MSLISQAGFMHSLLYSLMNAFSASAFMFSVSAINPTPAQTSTQTLAIPAATKSPTMPAQPSALGRLFHTADERTALDRGKPVAPVLLLPRPVASIAPIAPVANREPRVTGFVRRTDGIDTLFVDHKRSRRLANDNPALLQPKAVGRELANAREVVAK
jgi:hypothetical protein